MATVFPVSIDDYSDPPTDNSQTLGYGNGVRKHSEMHIDTNDAIEAIEAVIGVTDSTDPASVEYRLNNLIAKSFEAGEVIPAYKVIRIGTDGKAYLSDKDTASHNCNFIGISTDSALAGQTVHVQSNGYLEVGLSVGTAGEELYNGTSGVLDTTVPTTGFFLRVGEMVSDTEMMIRLDETIIL